MKGKHDSCARASCRGATGLSLSHVMEWFLLIVVGQRGETPLVPPYLFPVGFPLTSP